jgi:predicted AlkP superfamily phosphohydrolase/phosphomutase
MASKKLLMIGIDAGDIEFIRSSLADLPTFRHVLGEGVYFPLDSTVEYLSASVWPTFYTGLMPGDHGICQHIQWDPDSMRMRRLSDDWFYCEPFWYDLERSGLKICAVDVPFTYPSRLRRGVEIINWGSHDLMGPYEGTPSQLGRQVLGRFGKHPMGYEIPVNKAAKEIEVLHRQLLKGAQLKGKLLNWLVHNVEWDFFIGVFGECHRGGHILWPDADDPDPTVPEGALLDVYREVDENLGLILDSIDARQTMVLVFSLHGMRSNFSQEHFARRIMDRINARFMAETGGEHVPFAASPRPQSGLIRKLRESLPPRLQYAVARSVPVRVRDWVVGREVTGGVHWPDTRGIALRSDVHTFVRFNIAGRERDGILVADSEEHRNYQNWVVESFLGLKERGTGARIVKDVLAAHELLPGARQELLPDLIIRWVHRRRATEIYSDRLGMLTAEPETGRTGEHRTNGFAVILDQQPSTDRFPPLRHNSHFPEFVRVLLNCPQTV